MMSRSHDEATTAGVVPVEGFNSSDDGPTGGKREQLSSSNAGAKNGDQLANATTTAGEPKQHHGFMEKVGGGVLSLVGLGGAPKPAAAAPASEPAPEPASERAPAPAPVEAHHELDAKPTGNLEEDPYLAKEDDNHSESRPVGDGDGVKAKADDEHPDSRGGILDTRGGVFSLVGLGGASKPGAEAEEAEPDRKLNSEGSPLRKEAEAEDELPPNSIGAADEVTEGKTNKSPESDTRRPGFRRFMSRMVGGGGAHKAGTVAEGEPDVKAENLVRDPAPEDGAVHSKAGSPGAEEPEPDLKADSESDLARESVDQTPSPGVEKLEGEGDESRKIGETQESKPGILQKVGGGIFSIMGAEPSKPNASRAADPDPDVKANSGSDASQGVDHQLSSSTTGSAERGGEGNFDENQAAGSRSAPRVLEKVGAGVLSTLGAGGAPKSGTAEQEAEPPKTHSEKDLPFQKAEEDFPSSRGIAAEGSEGKSDESQGSTPGVFGKVGGGVLSMVGLGASKSDAAGEEAEPDGQKDTSEGDHLQNAANAAKSAAAEVEAERDPKVDSERDHLQEPTNAAKSAAAEVEAEQDPKVDSEGDHLQEPTGAFELPRGGEESEPYVEAKSERELPHEDQIPSLVGSVKGEDGNTDEVQKPRPGYLEKVGGGVLSMVGYGAFKPAGAGAEPDVQPASETDHLKESAGDKSELATSGEEAGSGTKANSERDLPEKEAAQLPSSVGRVAEGNKGNADEPQESTPGLLEKVGGGVFSMVGLGASKSKAPVGEEAEPDSKATAETDPLQKAADAAKSTAAGVEAEQDPETDLERDTGQEVEDQFLRSVGSVEEGDEQNKNETQTSRPGYLEKVGGGVLSAVGAGSSKPVEAGAEVDRQLPTSPRSVEEGGEGNVHEAKQSRPGVLEKVGGGVFSAVGAGNSKPAEAGAEVEPDVKDKLEPSQEPDDLELPPSVEKTRGSKPGVLEKVGGGVLSMVGPDATKPAAGEAEAEVEPDIRGASERDFSQKADHHLPSSGGSVVGKGDEAKVDDTPESKPGVLEKVGGGVLSMVGADASKPKGARVKAEAEPKEDSGPDILNRVGSDFWRMVGAAAREAALGGKEEVEPSDVKADSEREFPRQGEDQHLNSGASAQPEGQIDNKTPESKPGVLDKVGASVMSLVGAGDSKPAAAAPAAKEPEELSLIDGALVDPARPEKGPQQLPSSTLDKIGGGVKSLVGAGDSGSKPTAPGSAPAPPGADLSLIDGADLFQRQTKQPTAPEEKQQSGVGVAGEAGEVDDGSTRTPNDGGKPGLLEKVGGAVLPALGLGSAAKAVKESEKSSSDDAEVVQRQAKQPTTPEEKQQSGLGVSGEARGADDGSTPTPNDDGKPGFLEKVGGAVLPAVGLGGAVKAVEEAEKSTSAPSPREEVLSKSKELDRERSEEGLPQAVEHPEEVGSQQQQASSSPSDSAVARGEVQSKSQDLDRERAGEGLPQSMEHPEEIGPKPQQQQASSFPSGSVAGIRYMDAPRSESKAEEEPKAFEKDVEEVPKPGAAGADFEQQQKFTDKDDANILRENGDGGDATRAAGAGPTAAAEEEKLRTGSGGPALGKDPSLRQYLPKEGGGEATATPPGTPLVHRVEQMEQKHPPSPIDQSAPSSPAVPLSQAPGGQSRDWSAPTQEQAQQQQQPKSEPAESVNSAKTAKAPSDPIKPTPSVDEEQGAPGQTAEDSKQKRALKLGAGRFKSCFVSCVRPKRNRTNDD